MFSVKASVPGIQGLNIQNVCPKEPDGRSIFCKEHLKTAEEMGYKTDLKGFLRQCGATQTAGMQYGALKCIDQSINTSTQGK